MQVSGTFFGKNIFKGLADGLRPEIRPLLIYARKVGFPGHVFGEIFFWGRDLIVEF